MNKKKKQVLRVSAREKKKNENKFFCDRRNVNQAYDYNAKGIKTDVTSGLG